MNKGDIPTRDTIGSSICILPFDRQIDLIITWAKNRQNKVVCVANVHMLIEAWKNARFAEVLKQADLVTPDGKPLVWMLKSMGATRAERVAGMDIFLATCKRASADRISIFLLGSTPEILDRICERLQAEFPHLKIAGIESPPFDPLAPTAGTNIVETINASGAGIVFVALGCPKQECWMMEHRDRIQAVTIGVGGVFGVYARVLKEAPRFIQNAGFEWLFRLIQEPRRLWKRYATTMPIFIWLALKQLINN